MSEKAKLCPKPLRLGSAIWTRKILDETIESNLQRIEEIVNQSHIVLAEDARCAPTLEVIDLIAHRIRSDIEHLREHIFQLLNHFTIHHTPSTSILVDENHEGG